MSDIDNDTFSGKEVKNFIERIIELEQRIKSLEAELGKHKAFMAREHMCSAILDRDYWKVQAERLAAFVKDIRPFLGYDPEATINKRADVLLAAYTAKRGEGETGK